LAETGSPPRIFARTPGAGHGRHEPRGAVSAPGLGVLTSTVWGDGLINCPAGTPIKRGERVRFIPFAELLACH